MLNDYFHGACSACALLSANIGVHASLANTWAQEKIKILCPTSNISLGAALNLIKYKQFTHMELTNDIAHFINVLIYAVLNVC